MNWKRAILASGMLLLVGACANRQVIVAPTFACSELVPPAIWAPTPGVAIPGPGELAARSALLGQTGQLDKANSDKGSAHFITTECEKRMAKAVEAPSPWAWLPWVD